MSEKKNTWPGLVPMFRTFLHGGVKVPKLKRIGETGTPTTRIDYEGMHKYYRWFRQDEKVRRCIVVNALFASMTAGFETELEATGDLDKEQKEAVVKKFGYVKEYIDLLNKRVNMDRILFVSQVKRSIYGKTGWEIILKATNGPPDWMLSLQSPKLKPNPDENWQLKGFKYEGKENMYDVEEILYFTNLQLENDYEGLSDVEPIVDVCHARHNLLRENFAEIVRTIWAPYVILQADTAGMTPEKEDAFLDRLIEAAKSGKSLAFNKSVEATTVKIDINLVGLIGMLDKFEESILSEFGTPRFLMGKPIENRATAYAELEAYIQGPIAHIQRYFKRELERQWYDRWTRYALKEQGVDTPKNEDPPVLLKHVWNPIRVVDVYEMAKAVGTLYHMGLGILADFPDLAFEMMGWPQERLEEELEKREELLKGLPEPSKPLEEPEPDEEPPE